MNQIEKTILDQFGGLTALHMIGGTVHTGHGLPELRIRFRAGNSKYKNLIIRLDADDTYTMELRRPWKGKTLIKTKSGIYNDNLMDVFEHATGLYLTFHRR